VLFNEFAGVAAVIATRRSGYPSQITNVPAFPGVFEGARLAAVRSVCEKSRTGGNTDSVLAERSERNHVQCPFVGG
jgi:malic enzyme